MGANAQTSVPAFTAGQVLTAAQMTQVNTGIPVFASSTERDAAFGGTGEKTLAEGQMAYLEDTNATQYYDGSSWAAVAGGKILQVVSAAKTDTFSTTSTTYTTVTGLSVSITPSAATSKVLLIANLQVSLQATVGASGHFKFAGGNAAVTGNAGTGTQSFASESDLAAGYESWRDTQTRMMVYLDSPASATAQTYTVEAKRGTIGAAVYVNQSGSPATNRGLTVSTLTALEVSA